MTLSVPAHIRATLLGHAPVKIADLRWGPEGESFSRGVHGARGLFSFFVVIYHVWNSGLPVWELPGVLAHFLTSLKFGVEMFFAISGFVILGTMQRSATPGAFLVNRMSRIFPVLWVVILVFLPLGIAGQVTDVTNWLDPGWLFGLILAGNLLAMGPILPVPVLYGAAWTIGYEFIFYYICFAWLAAKHWLRLDLRLPLVIFGVLLALFYPRGLFFIAGVITITGALNNTVFDRLSREPLVWLLAYLMLWGLLPEPGSPVVAPVTAWFGSWDLPLGLASFFCALLAIHGIAHGYGLLGRFLTTAPLIWLGTISYSLYLWHPVVLGVVKAGLYRLGIPDIAGEWSQMIFLILVTPVSLILGHYSQKILEVRVSGWLRARFTRKPRVPLAQRATASDPGQA